MSVPWLMVGVGLSVNVTFDIKRIIDHLECAVSDSGAAPDFVETSPTPGHSSPLQSTPDDAIHVKCRHKRLQAEHRWLGGEIAVEVCNSFHS